MRNSGEKIFGIKQLKSELNKLERDANSTYNPVLCHGVFDIVHAGHLEHFKQAKKFGSPLIVSVTADSFVNKGPNRPVFSHDVRADFIASLEIVDFVVISKSDSAEDTILALEPRFYVKGEDYQVLESDASGRIIGEKNAIESIGGQLLFTGGFRSSSSRLINLSHFSWPDETMNILSEIKRNTDVQSITNWVDKLVITKPYILGEFILDEYSQCNALSKSSKDPILAFSKDSSKEFLGGTAAIAHNISSWGIDCCLVIIKDPADSYTSKFLESKLKDSVKVEYILEEGYKSIRKHRFVENHSKVKVFEYYDYNPEFLTRQTSKKILDGISSRSFEHGPLILADYGHGFFTEDIIRGLDESRLFLAVNTQANAGNRGFNTISKYPRADFISLNGGELELEFRSKDLDYAKIIPQIMESHRSRNALVTLGSEGMLVFDESRRGFHIPALAKKVVDKVGAGDAVLAIASMLSFLGAPKEVIGLLSSIVAAHEVSQMGHGSSLSLLDIKRAVIGVLA